jgi:hypothetical protein
VSVDMTEIYPGVIEHPSAWTAASIGGKEGLVRRLAAPELAALAGLAARHRGRPVPEITREGFADPAVDALMQAVRDEVMHGRGAMILAGLDPGGYAPDELERLFWGLGTHLGNGVVQGYRGDWVARVERNPDGPFRGTTTDIELRGHTDFHEVMALAAVRRAAEGGVSGLASSLAVHNAIRTTRPELLAPLYRGFYHESDTRRILSDRPVPMFCCIDGTVSCLYNAVFMRRAAQQMGVALPPDLVEAMAWFDTQAARPDIRLDFVLEPGEMLFWHNFQMLHSRTRFRDSDEHRRLLLRLWLNVPGGRQVAPEIAERARIMDEEHALFGLGSGRALPPDAGSWR